MSSLIPQEPQGFGETAHAIGDMIKATPGLSNAIYETIQAFWTDQIKFRRRKQNLEHEFQLAEQMIRGKKRLDDISAVEASRVLEASIVEDREGLQKLWAAMIARLLTGDLPTVRKEWVEIVKGLELIDAGILQLLPNVRNIGPNGGAPSFIEAISKDFSSRWPNAKLQNNDFFLSFQSLEAKGLLTLNGYLQKRPDGSWPPAWSFTALGQKIIEITTPP